MRGSLPTVVVALCAALVPYGSARADTFLNENFEGLPLQPFTSPTESGGDGTDWTSALPAGWTATFPSPIGNPVEFQGWRVLDVDSWIATEGNQNRSAWTRGGVGARGSVLLVDPDAYDDGTNIDTSLFNASILTPAINLATIVPGTAAISFDSFYRAEVESDLFLDVSFDGGATFTNLMTVDSATVPDGAVFDEHLSFPVNNPATGSLQFRFSLRDGSNDWWWAVDNVEVTGQAVPEPSSLAVLAGALATGMFAGRRGRRRT